MSTTEETRVPKGRASRRRSEHARLAVVRAADNLLAELGFAAVTIEGIATRAGVAKQTIYRWWPSKVDVLLDSLLDDAYSQLIVPGTGPAVEGARRYLHGLARFLGPQRENERSLLQRGIAAGELAPGLDVDAVLDALKCLSREGL